MRLLAVAVLLLALFSALVAFTVVTYKDGGRSGLFSPAAGVLALGMPLAGGVLAGVAMASARSLTTARMAGLCAVAVALSAAWWPVLLALAEVA